MPDHDGDYKVIFSYPETVEALLRGFVRERWVRRLDFSTLERVNASHVSERLRARHGDTVSPAVPRELRRRLPRLDFLLLDESRLSPAELDQPENVTAGIFRVETATPGELLDRAEELAPMIPPRPELRRAITLSGSNGPSCGNCLGLESPRGSSWRRYP